MGPSGTLLIGYGSSIRGDDAVGLRVAEAIEARRHRAVTVIACYLLTPELAEPLSEARRAIFADAAVDVPDGKVRVTRVYPEGNHQVMVHTASPSGTLKLAKSVFGHCPEAWLVSIPVTERNMGIGEGLSSSAQLAVERAVEEIEVLIGSESEEW